MCEFLLFRWGYIPGALLFLYLFLGFFFSFLGQGQRSTSSMWDSIHVLASCCVFWRPVITDQHVGLCPCLSDRFLSFVSALTDDSSHVHAMWTHVTSSHANFFWTYMLLDYCPCVQQVSHGLFKLWSTQRIAESTNALIHTDSSKRVKSICAHLDCNTHCWGLGQSDRLQSRYKTCWPHSLCSFYMGISA